MKAVPRLLVTAHYNGAKTPFLQFALNYNVIVPLCTVPLLKCNLLNRLVAVSPSTFPTNLAGKQTHTHTHTDIHTHKLTCI